MKNILIIAMIVVAIGYMFVIMGEKYDNAVKVNDKLSTQKQAVKPEEQKSENVNY
ncbi:MAG: hypothetical protein ABF301_01675 [Sulfurovum sp.]